MSARFFGKDGRHILKITDNEWVAACEGWDTEIDGNKFTFRNALRDDVLSFTLHPPDTIEIHAYRFNKNDCVLDADPGSITFSEHTGESIAISKNQIKASIVGVHLVTDDRLSTTFIDTIASMGDDDWQDYRYLIQPADFYEDD